MAITVGEIEQLFCRDGARLPRFVAFAAGAPEAIAEDACQVAWGRLLGHRDDVDADTATGWVARTAVREARKGVQSAGRHCGLEVAEDRTASPAAAVDDRAAARHRLGGLRALPARQQRLLWLRGLGFSYREMAAHEGCTPRTVERQLARARHAVAAAGL